MKLKAIFFDLQGVLTQHGRMFSEDLPKAWTPEVTREETTRRYYANRLSKKLNAKEFFAGVPAKKKFEFIKLSKLHDGARETVTLLAKKYPLYIASNHLNQLFEEELKHIGLDHYFTQCFVSYKLGVAKPDAAFYKTMLEKAKVKATESLFIDDTKTNLEGAKKLGITTVWVNNHTDNPRNNIDFTPDYEIKDLRELIAIVQGLQ